MSIVPTTDDPGGARRARRSTAPRAPASTRAEALDVGRKWEPGGSTRNCDPQGVDCGAGSIAKVSRFGDDLYFFVHVQDDFQSYAVKPAECVGHWQADSVEILIDPRGNSSEREPRHGVDLQARRVPVHERPGGLQRQRARTGRAGRATPTTTRATRPGRWRTRSTTRRTPRASRSRLDATWVGSNEHDRRPRLRGRRLHARGQDPAGRPAGRRGPGPDRAEHHALRQRRQHGGAGLDDAAPHRQEHAARVVDVRQRAVRPVPLGPRDAAGLHAAGRAARRAADPNVSHPNLDGAESPQTIAQSARDGVPISGRVPAPRGRPHHRGEGDPLGRLDEVALTANGPGTARLYLVVGRDGLHPGVHDQLRPGGRPGARLRAVGVLGRRRRRAGLDEHGRAAEGLEDGRAPKRHDTRLDAGGGAGARVVRDAAGPGAGASSPRRRLTRCEVRR